MTKHPQVAIIGAGIVGAATAFLLARRGVDVDLLEAAAAPATGSTGRSAAGLRHQFTLPANVAFSRFGAERYARFAEEVGADAGFRRVGYLFLVPPEQSDAWRADRVMQEAAGVRIEHLSPEELARRAPYLSTDGVAFGSFGPDDGVLDPHAATLGYLTAAQAAGARLHVATPVTGLKAHAGGWQVESGDARWRVDRVVNAAGAWAGGVAALAGASLPVVASRRDVFVTGPVHGLALPTPLVIDAATGVWWRSEGERLLIGRSNPNEAPGFRSGVDWAWFEVVLAAALPRFPFLSEVGLDRRASWWGWYEVTPDHLPAIGEAPDAPGLFHVAGFSGHGVQHAPAAAHAVTSLILAGNGGGFDLTPFDPARFARGGGGGAEARVV
jgi:sarcosine oxidase, subunit beta